MINKLCSNKIILQNKVGAENTISSKMASWCNSDKLQYVEMAVLNFWGNIMVDFWQGIFFI